MSATTKLLGGSNGNDQEFIVYTYRWLILALFVFSGLSNALLILTWAPISDKANEYWGGIGITAVNMLAVMFQICYIPGTTMALYISKKYDLRMIMLCGGLLTSFGCLLRWIGAYAKDYGNFSNSSSYALIIVGTAVAALAQPFYLNMPAKIASAWFAVPERDFSTTMCSLANPLGSAIGSALPALIVQGGNDDMSSVTGVSTLLLVQLVSAVAALVLTGIFFRSNPLTPPSNSAQQMQANAADSSGEGRDMSKFVGVLVANKEYMKLLFAFTIGLGNLNAIAALLNQLPGGYTNAEVGLTGTALILCGFFGAFVTGFVLDKTKAYRVILKTTYSLALGAWVLFVVSCRSGKFAFFIASAAALGLFLLPTIPATIVNSVECAYPVPEDLAVGLLYIGANTLAIALTFIGQVLLSYPASSMGPAVLFPYGVWVVATMAIGLVPILWFNGQSLRLQQDLRDISTAFDSA